MFIIDQPHIKTILKFLHNLTKKVSSISINYKYSTKNIYNNIIADLDPSYSFRLGLDENPDENNNLAGTGLKIEDLLFIELKKHN